MTFKKKRFLAEVKVHLPVTQVSRLIVNNSNNNNNNNNNNKNNNNNHVAVLRDAGRNLYRPQQGQ
jgi:hypothetical protein